ncbi:hypothetical protein G2W53_002394 [Senna tora]|uniref:Uncharacterized protein n=1 Tax=Senna tora TaxID=362788 RepID=A0A835CKB2_9FABA|nr:hypothetical protein G2W53_002394 [Senna tora]
MSSSLEADQNQKACNELEKLNLQEGEQKPRSKVLYDTLYDLFQKEAKQLKKRYRDEKKRRANSSSSDANASSCNIVDPLASIQRPEEDDGSAMNQWKQQGRKIKNEVVFEEILSLSLPPHFDVSSVKDVDMNLVIERLGRWRVQRRERNSKMTDTYYCHLSSRHTFRSIPEVIDFVMGVESSRLKTSPRKNKGDNKKLSDESSSKRARKNKRKLEEVENTNYINVESELFEDPLDEAFKYLEGKNVDEMLREFDEEPFMDLQHLFSDDFDNEIEMQAPVIPTNSEKVEFVLPTEANNNNDLKPEFETLEEAIEKLANVDLEELTMKDFLADNVDDILNDYFEECDLVSHIPVSQDVPELSDFLINNRNNDQNNP